MKDQRAPSNTGTLKKSKPGRKNEPLNNGDMFGTDEVRAALFHVQDALERSQIQFVLLDEVAYQVAHEEDPQLKAQEVSIGVKIQDFTQSGSSTLRSIIPDAGWEHIRHGEKVGNLSYNVGSVPVVIWVIHGHFNVLDYPDTRFYYNTEFRLPNPFKTYWNIRDIMK